VKVNRRELVALAIAGSAGAKALAQSPATPVTPSGVRDFLAEARTSHRDDAAELAKIELPQSTEPAFEFRP
jgi:hypothetical protein